MGDFLFFSYSNLARILFAENPSTSILVNGAELIGNGYLVLFVLFTPYRHLTASKSGEEIEDSRWV